MGYVHCYFSHVQSGETHFLAVVEVMKKHEFGDFNIPVVTRNSRSANFRKIAVLDVADILHSVGLIQYTSSEYKYKVVWPYAKFYEKIGGRTCGRLQDL